MTAYAANITPDLATGIGNWTEAQPIHAIGNGRRPDGALIGLPMPFDRYRHISDNDVDAIVAHFRSLPPSPSKQSRLRRSLSGVEAVTCCAPTIA